MNLGAQIVRVSFSGRGILHFSLWTWPPENSGARDLLLHPGKSNTSWLKSETGGMLLSVLCCAHGTLPILTFKTYLCEIDRWNGKAVALQASISPAPHFSHFSTYNSATGNRQDLETTQAQMSGSTVVLIHNGVLHRTKSILLFATVDGN